MLPHFGSFSILFENENNGVNAQGNLVELKLISGKAIEAKLYDGIRDIKQIPAGTEYRIMKYEGVGYQGKNPTFTDVTNDMTKQALSKSENLNSPAPAAGKEGGGGETLINEAELEEQVSSAVPASPSFFHSSEDISKYAKNIKPLKGYEDVTIHATSTEFWLQDKVGKWYKLSPKQFAKRIRQSPNYYGGKIRLIACNSAEKGVGTGAAQELADELGVQIMAPTDKVWIWDDGRLNVGVDEFTPTGTWIIITPRR
jgi:hypothetical protein